MIRVLLAEDSPVVCAVVRSVLEADPELEVVGVARDGQEAVELTRRLRPDVLVMDVRMPRMDGIAATQAIMADTPVPILVVSDAALEDTAVAFRAIQAGAVDVVQKPSGTLRADYGPLELVRHVKLVARVPPIRRGRPRTPPVASTPSVAGDRVVAIGASTGGPPALATVLGALPAELPASVLVVQHIARGFLAGLVDWLRSATQREIRIAEAGEPLRDGVIYFAPEDRHLGLAADRRLLLSDAGPEDGHRPSASHLLRSVAEAAGPCAVGVLLTGMGRDGAAGLLALRERGGRTICQDAETAVVWGMPGAAVGLGAAEAVVPLDAIAEVVVGLLASSDRAHTGWPG